MFYILHKGSISAAALAFGVLIAPAHTFAVKTVPTIRIEIPQQNPPDQQNAPPLSLPIAPGVPFGDEESAPAADESDENAQPDVEKPEPETRLPVEIFYGDGALPEPVKTLRAQLIEIAHTGEIEKLRPLFDTFRKPPLVSFDGDADPIELLKAASGDGEGREILAILLEVLESGYVHREEGTDGDIYIWPYFVDVAPEDLNARQLVELFRIITAGDFEDMKAYGTYIFYRIGITPDGQMKFFIAGD